MRVFILTKSFFFILLLLIFTSCSFSIKKNGTLSLKGLQAPVEVFTDKYGVPHIKAQNKEDMMMALGYVTASDRLFQMDLIRRIGSGRLSEIFGEKMIEADKFLRNLMIKKKSTQGWQEFKKTAPPEMLKETSAYFKGVNQYIQTAPLPVEMKILRYKPEPFSFEDSLAAIGYMSLSFAEALTVDVMYSDLLDELPIEEIELLFSRGSLEAPESKNLSQLDHSFKVQPKYYSSIVSPIKLLADEFKLFHGSNAWLLSPKRSKSGKAILANDPHIGFSNPSVWYEVHIQSPDFESYGHYMPVIPFPGLSHNKNRAWGITMAKFNDMDIFKEKLHPENKKLVMYKGKYQPLLKHVERIKVKGKESPVEYTFYESPHGPMINSKKYKGTLENFSITWQFLNPNNNIGLALYKLNYSKELSDLEPALAPATSPSFSFSFADSKGNIGWRVLGAIPILREGLNGKTVLDGASGKDEYLGYTPNLDNPHLYNPESGVIVNANHKPYFKKNEKWQGLWLSKERYLGIHQLLATQEKWSLEELKKIQTQEKVINLQYYKDHLYSRIEPQNNAEKEALKHLKKWDGSSSKDSVASSIHEKLLLKLIAHIVSDELGPERAEAYLEGGNAMVFLNQILKKPNSVLWDNLKSSDKKESSYDIIQLSFHETVRELEEQMGSFQNSWQWGKIHQLTFEHPIGKFFPLNVLLNLGPYSVGGAGNQINNFGHTKYLKNPDISYGPSTRRLIDFKDPTESFGILPTGNSGQPFSKHYKDQIQLFINNKYRKQIMDFEKLEQPVKKLVLKPKSSS